MMPSAGLEPATLMLEASCSIPLSYEGASVIVRAAYVEKRLRAEGKIQ